MPSALPPQYRMVPKPQTILQSLDNRRRQLEVAAKRKRRRRLQAVALVFLISLSLGVYAGWYMKDAFVKAEFGTLHPAKGLRAKHTETFHALHEAGYDWQHPLTSSDFRRRLKLTTEDLDFLDTLNASNGDLRALAEKLPEIPPHLRHATASLFLTTSELEKLLEIKELYRTTYGIEEASARFPCLSPSKATSRWTSSSGAAVQVCLVRVEPETEQAQSSSH